MSSLDTYVDALLFVALVARAGIRANIAMARGWLTSSGYETIPTSRIVRGMLIRLAPKE